MEVKHEEGVQVALSVQQHQLSHYSECFALGVFSSELEHFALFGEDEGHAPVLLSMN